MHLLNLKSADGWEVGVPVALPDAITFDCFIPGVGIVRACVHPTSLDPSEADVGEVDVWDPKTSESFLLTGRQDDALLEQAGDVLAYIVDRLTRPDMHDPAPILRAIANMAHAEAIAREAWESLPESVREESHRLGSIPKDPERHRDDMPSAHALAAYVTLLMEEAQTAARRAAKEREDAWTQEQAEEYAAARRAERADHAVDAWKDGR